MFETEKNLAQKFEKILSRRFIYSDDVSRILSVAFRSHKNVIIYGPAGHGKSEMVTALIEGLGIEEETFYQFFGEGMDEARLYGGLNFRKLEEEKVLEYHPENSFLAKKIAVFEEVFDAPPNVLLALKDTLTAKALRNGAQYYPMRTEVIICLTNKEPAEISDLGPAAHALTERFPLQLNLRWTSYSSMDYLTLFKKIEPRMKGPSFGEFKSVLADVLAQANAQQCVVSPRTAVHAFQICQASASLRSSEKVETNDLLDLKFLPGLEALTDDIQDDMKQAVQRAAAQKVMEDIELAYEEVLKHVNKAGNSVIKQLQAGKVLSQFLDKVSSARVTDDMVPRRDTLMANIQAKIEKCKEDAWTQTRVQKGGAF